MKTIEEIYGSYMTEDIAHRFVELTECTITILKFRRQELIDKSLHHPLLSSVCNDLEFHERLQNQYKQFLKDNK